MIRAVYARDEYDLEIVEKGGFIFLHIHLYKWGVGAVKALKEDVQFVKEVYAKEGHDVVFALTEDQKITKLWNMVEKCYDLQQLRDKSWLGAWLTEEI